MPDSLIPKLPGFDDPVSVLRACHDRMLAHCDTLERLAPHIQDKGCDDEAGQAIDNVLRYFSTSAMQHHADEEQDLFPAISHQSPELDRLLSRLRVQHQHMNALWQQVAQDLKAPADLADNPDFAPRVAEFCALYRAHIDLENTDLLSLAASRLGNSQLESIGRAMARRRGVRY